jgi:cytochrome P450 family 4 subfamily V
VLGSGGPGQKSSLYTFLHPWLHTGLLTSYGDKWKTRRRMITPSFHFDILKSYVGVFQQHTAKLLDKLDSKLAAPFSIYPLMTHLALDIITECACGEAVGALEGGNSEYVTAVYAQLSVTFERLMQPWLWWDPFYWHCTLSGRRSAQQLRTLHSHTMAMIARRREVLAARKRDGGVADGISGKIFLDTLLAAKDEHGNGLSDGDIREVRLS